MVRLIPMQYAPILSTTSMQVWLDSSVRRAMLEIQGMELDTARQMGPGAAIPLLVKVSHMKHFHLIAGSFRVSSFIERGVQRIWENVLAVFQ